ncbi:MAG: S-layer homology domain-containing protein, partial [Defluviitaleaceae bacterium]|nr:S-layer homology domain-containing protein [Defluviitaleaceae bacterium]
MKTTLKRALCFALILVISGPYAVFANGEGTEDFLIQTDPVESTYIGRVQASRLIQQLRFTDLPPTQAGQDAIIRSGALEAIRPAAPTFRPNAPITREEAIAYSLRTAGLSEMAMLMATALDIPPNTPLGTAWSLGYLQLASTMGMILPENFEAALSDVNMQFNEIVDGIDIAQAWDRTENATREEIAFWLATALRFAQGDIFENNAVGISLQSFTDWNSINVQAAEAVELLLRNNVISGQTATIFGPSSAVTRQQMAQFIRNLDEMHYGIHGLVRRVGTVADIWNEQYTETGAGTLWNHIHVRRADGGVDMLQFTLTGGPSPQTGALDAVTLRGGNVGGLNSLEIGDQIEYLVHPVTNTVWYVLVTNEVVTQTFRGRLELIDMERGTMTFRNEAGTVYTFPMSRGLFGTDHN